jgi:AraC family transcriptional regulator, alkane utilization regulator
MDALSQILDDIHLRGAEYLYVMGQRDWHFELNTQGLTVFYIIMTGEMQLTAQDQDIYNLVAGDMVVIPSGQQHAVFSNTQARLKIAHPLIHEFRGHRNDPVRLQEGRSDTLVLCIRCLLDVDMAKPLLSALPTIMLIRNMTGQGAPDWLQIGLQFLALEAVRTRPGRDTLMNRLVGMLLIECVRDHVEQLPQGSDSWLTALSDPQLSPVLTAIHANPAGSWTVAELASLACMSRSGFAERFSDVMGQPPLSYLAAHRLRLAAWNLREHQYSVSRISELVGYGSETSFSQAFKRHFGVSPSQYRRSNPSFKT